MPKGTYITRGPLERMGSQEDQGAEEEEEEEGFGSASPDLMVLACGVGARLALFQ